ncbi:dihydroxyacetone kinase phosphoryl donor subunit DhaM [Brachybacterium sp. DNPG3]
MTGIVVVSHSRPLAEAAVALAAQMLGGDGGPRLEVAAGLSETELGTDALAIQEAIERAADAQGVLVLMDLGSALMSAEMALEMLDPELAGRVRLSPAPLVEGLVGAAAVAAGGADLERVAAEAEIAVEAKRAHLATLRRD